MFHKVYCNLGPSENPGAQATRVSGYIASASGVANAAANAGFGTEFGRAVEIRELHNYYQNLLEHQSGVPLPNIDNDMYIRDNILSTIY